MKKWIISLIIASLGLLRAEDIKNPIVTMITNHGEVSIELLAESAPETVNNFIGLAEGTKEWTTPNGDKVKKPFYDGLTFHRIINNFMIQGGCPSGTGRGKPGYTFKDEINANSLGLHEAKVFDPVKGYHSYLKIYPSYKVEQLIAQPILTKLGINSKETFQAKKDEFNKEVEKSKETITLKELYQSQGYSYNTKLTSYPMKTGYLAMANSGPNSNGSQFFINLKDNRYLDGKHTVFGKVISGMEIVKKIAAVKTGTKDAPIEEVQITSIRLKK